MSLCRSGTSVGIAEESGCLDRSTRTNCSWKDVEGFQQRLANTREQLVDLLQAVNKIQRLKLKTEQEKISHRIPPDEHRHNNAFPRSNVAHSDIQIAQGFRLYKCSIRLMENLINYDKMSNNFDCISIKI